MAERLSAGTPTDATMDNRIGITDPPAPTPGPSANFSGPAFDAAVDKAFEAKASTLQTQFTQQREADKKSFEKSEVLACLGTYISGSPGEDLPTATFKNQIQDLILQVHAGSDKPHDEILKEAAKFSEARLQTIVEAQGDGAQNPTQLRRQTMKDHGLFSMPNFLDGLQKDIESQGSKFSLNTLGKESGNEELEFISSGLSADVKAFTDKRVGELQAAARKSAPNAVVIPFPASAIQSFTGPDARFAETYAESITAAAERREPTMRADLLVPFFRPDTALEMLGVPMPTIANDQTLPRLSASLAAAWLAENTAITDGNLTVVSVTTSPKRLGVRDDVSWMNLAAANSQLAITPLVTSEMSRAVAQAGSAAVFAGTGSSNQPTGINATTGITSQTIAADAPTYDNLLALPDGLAAANIPDTEGRYAITSGTRRDLATRLRFGTSMAGGNRALYEREPYSGPVGGPISGNMGYVVDFPAAVTNNLPTDLTNNDDEHLTLFGSWQYVIMFQYAMAFLTIDDVSQAASGQTRITVNKYCDIVVRLPKAFSKLQYNPNA